LIGLAAVRQFFVNYAPAPCGVVAAVSGGVDSTALLLALAPLRQDGFGVAAAHVNHHLRGTDSDGDEAFVRELCARLGVPLHVLDGTLDAKAVRERGIEAAARAVRYVRLLALREGLGARWIATAHQQDDQAETVLMRIVTGSGLSGLRGIHPMRADGVLRPLLHVSRAELDTFLTAEGIAPRHDRSNDDPRFLRNRVRALLTAAPADVRTQLAAVADNAQRFWPFAERVLDRFVESDALETRFVYLPEDLWLRQAILHRHIQRLDPSARDISSKDLERLASQLETIPRTSVTRQLELIRRKGTLVLARRHKPPTVTSFELDVTLDVPTPIPTVGLTIHLATSGAPSTAQAIQLPPYSAPRFTIRNRRPGDRFQPLGMRNSKKLKDFLIDRKIAAGVRDRLPLLVCDGEIVCIAGVAVSERFKVTSPPQGVIYQVWLEELA
jgi:tRNA(Ile)-lysidine synthase